jgi:osmoprotectant transport system ATP-binding protein
VIVLTNVKKSYGPKSALGPIDMTIEKERSLALVGPSGSGKSTLLRLVLGLLAPDTGTIRVAAELMTPASAQKLRLSMGYVIQDGGLFPHLSALDNVALVARLLRWDRTIIDERIETLTALAGLSAELLSHYPVELSGGERQRVGLMRALMLDPPVLLLDEPLGALDPIIRARLQEDLRRIFRELKKTVLLVTHDLGEAAFLGDEIALLHDGVLVQKGTLKELVQRPKDSFVSEFLQAQRPRWSEGLEAP